MLGTVTAQVVPVEQEAVLIFGVPQVAKADGTPNNKVKKSRIDFLIQLPFIATAFAVAFPDAPCCQVGAVPLVVLIAQAYAAAP